jgi:hypothetical protein
MIGIRKGRENADGPGLGGWWSDLRGFWGVVGRGRMSGGVCGLVARQGSRRVVGWWLRMRYGGCGVWLLGGRRSVLLVRPLLCLGGLSGFQDNSFEVEAGDSDRVEDV